MPVDPFFVSTQDTRTNWSIEIQVLKLYRTQGLNSTYQRSQGRVSVYTHVRGSPRGPESANLRSYPSSNLASMTTELKHFEIRFLTIDTASHGNLPYNSAYDSQRRFTGRINNVITKSSIKCTQQRRKQVNQCAGQPNSQPASQ